MIGIIGAMDTEVDNIKAQVKGKTVSEVAGVEFVCGRDRLRCKMLAG